MPKYMFDCIGVYSEGRAAAGIWEGQWRYGYIDNTGHVVIVPKYRDARGFSGRAASVGVADSGNNIKYGFINKDGFYLIEPKFDET